MDKNTLKKKELLPPLRYDNKMPLDQDREAPDPFILRFDGMYYLYFTVGGRKMFAYQSNDLLHFEMVDNGILEKGVIYDYDQDKNAPESETPFAPEVCYYDGTFYMIASPSGNGHYLFASSSPKGPFRCISKNLGRKIDGSFFLDGDERIYLYAAYDDALKVYSVSDDFKNIGVKETFLSPCHLGRWNEGPYMLKRYGRYYLTYCGAHFLSTDYRVDYATSKDVADLMSPLFYKREGTVLISTEKDFYGLGHSCTVLGPDLDSYFLVYHNLLDDRRRYFNLSRISFYGEKMALNGVRTKDIPFVESAFCAKDFDALMEENGAYVIDKMSEETFSVEYNNIGKGRMVFSYRDSNHYGFLDFDGKSLVLGKKDYEEKILKTMEFHKEFSSDVVHSYLIQYRKGYLALYFDHMEKLYAFPCEYSSGRAGYLLNHTFHEIHATFLSRFALGSSEEEYFKDHILFANSYDSALSQNVLPTSPYVHLGKESLASYHIDIPEDGNYNLYVTLRKGYHDQWLTIQRDGFTSPVFLEKEESGKEEDEVYVTTISFKKGPQTLSLSGDENIYFSEIVLEKEAKRESQSFDFTKGQDESSFFFRNTMKKTEEGYLTGEEKSSGLLYDVPLASDIVSMTLTPLAFEDGGELSLLFHASEFCNNFVEDGDGKDNPNSYRGFALTLTKNEILLKKVDFNYTEVLARKPYSPVPGKKVVLRMEEKDNRLSAYLDGECYFDLLLSSGNRQGRFGFLAYRAKAVLSSMEIQAEDKQTCHSLFFH